MATKDDAPRTTKPTLSTSRRVVGFAAAVMGVMGVAAVAPMAAGETPASTATVSADYQRGKLLYIQCRACHDVKPSPIEKVGPNLSGLMDRPAGRDAEFAYSPALARSKLIWDRATLDRWLARPGELVPGNTMAFAGVANPADRAALIAYLEVETRTP